MQRQAAVFKITILFPRQRGARFDFGYYLDVHIARSIRKLEVHPGFRGVSVERGLVGARFDEAGPRFLAACHYEFTSVEAFHEAFLPHAAELQADLANYTDIAPLVETSEVLLRQPAPARR